MRILVAVHLAGQTILGLVLKFLSFKHSAIRTIRALVEAAAL